MNNNLDKWKPMIDEFEQSYPYLVSSAVNWYPYSRNEIVIEFDDGSKRIFEYFTRTIRNLNFADEDTRSEDEWREEFSKRLTERMRRYGMMRWQLSQETGISEVMLSKYMNGKAIPSSYNTRKIARALNCSVGYLSEF